MSEAGRLGKTLVLGTLAAAFGAGAVAGVIAERALIGRNVRRTEPGEPFGTLHTDAVTVIADDGVELHAEVEPAFEGHDDVTVVFVHGFALRMDEFHYQRRDLRGFARMVFFDQRGHGRSQRGERESHRIPQLAADLERVIEQCVPTGDIVLVGHSMGGMTVQALAARRPEWFGRRIKAVVLVCTSSGGMTEVPLGLPGGIGKFVQQVAPMVTGALHGQQELVDRSRETASDLTRLITRRYAFGSGVAPDLTEFVAHMHGNTPIEVIGDFLGAFVDYDSKATLPVMGSCYTTVIAATGDLMTPPEHGREIAELVPEAEYIEMADTGHMLPLERYTELNELIRRELRRVRMAEA